jgi:hypothetical protein
VFGDQIYIAGLIESARKTHVGDTWLLDRVQVIVDLGITDRSFDEMLPLIEIRLPGKWSKLATADEAFYVYRRIE